MNKHDRNITSYTFILILSWQLLWQERELREQTLLSVIKLNMAKPLQKAIGFWWWDYMFIYLLGSPETFWKHIFLLTGLRIYTGKYKAQGPTLCPTEGRALRGPRALYSPV